MQLDTGQWIVIVISAVLIFAYIIGYFNNRELGRKVVAWLRMGLEQWGPVTLGEPLGGMTTGGSFIVNNASEPFQKIEAIYLLEPRENIIFWLFDLLRGRRDELILKIGLRSVPDPDAMIEAGKGGDKHFQQTTANDGKTYTTVNLDSGIEFALISKKTTSDERARQFLEKYPESVTRFSVQRQNPHIFVRARLKNLMNQPSQEFIADVGKLSKKVPG